MSEFKFKWEAVEEMDLDDGTHTCYAATDKTGRFVWLTQNAEDTWDVEMGVAPDSTHFHTMATCKTLPSAKRWAARYLA